MNLSNPHTRRNLKILLLALSPYALLLILLLINPLIAQSKYCPLPTFLENDFGPFPSPISAWFFYVIAIPILELFLLPLWLSLSGIWKGLVSIIYPERWHEAWRRIFLGLPFTILIFSVLLTMGVLFLGNEIRIYRDVFEVFVFLLVPATGIAILGTTIWILVVGILERRSEDPEVRKRGLRTIGASVLGFVICFALPLMIGILSIGFLSTGSASTSVPSAPGGGGGFANPMGAPSLPSFESSDTIGFSVGGAKDADNFRENIENCYLPTPSDITYEGLFYDYSFDTQHKTPCTTLFCPQYEGAIVPDPFNNQDEYFLSVGLGSNIKEEDFARPPLDVVVVLDISGSMSSTFNKYYYDRFRTPGELLQEINDWNKSKMEIAKEAIGAMVDRMQPDDRFGLVVYDSNAQTILTAERMGENGYARAKNAIFNLEPRGGTNMGAGLEEGTRVMKALSQDDEVDREKRIIFLTDAMPNTGQVESNELYVIGERNSEEGIHTTYIGIGVDFNTELVEILTKKIRGANYYAIHSSSDFEKRLDVEFEYLVAPLVYDLELAIDGGDYEIRTVYGSPEANLATGEILKVSTLFPSPTKEGSSRGGIILAHMKKTGDLGQPTHVVARYTDRAGEEHEILATVVWKKSAEESSANVRKAVLLSRYANLMQNWIIDENLRLGPHEKTIYLPIQPVVFYERGLVVPTERYSMEPNVGTTGYSRYELGRWERLSRKLKVSEDYKQVFGDFKKYFEAEVYNFDEQDLLERETTLLQNLIDSPDA